MEMMPILSGENVKIRIADTLRMFVGHGRRLSWADLAAATGDKESKLRSYVEADGSQMPLDVFMRVFTVLPPEAFAKAIRPMGFSSAPLDVDSDATLRRALSLAARLVADGNEFLENGRLSPSEAATLSDAAGALIPVLQSIAGNGATV